MQIEGKLTILVNVWKVWESLTNIETITALIPGIEGKTEIIDENTFENDFSQKVSFFKVSLKTRTVIIKKEPPSHMAFSTDGKDAGTGTALNAQTDIFLKEISKDETEISYKIETRITGKLAIFAENIMNNKSKEIKDTIVSNLRAKIEK